MYPVHGNDGLLVNYAAHNNISYPPFWTFSESKLWHVDIWFIVYRVQHKNNLQIPGLLNCIFTRMYTFMYMHIEFGSECNQLLHTLDTMTKTINTPKWIFNDDIKALNAQHWFHVEEIGKKTNVIKRTRIQRKKKPLKQLADGRKKNLKYRQKQIFPQMVEFPKATRSDIRHGDPGFHNNNNISIYSVYKYIPRTERRQFAPIHSVCLMVGLLVLCWSCAAL